MVILGCNNSKEAESDCNILGGFPALGNFLIVRVYTSSHTLNLMLGLKSAIAQGFPIPTGCSIPLSSSFQRQGLGFRSAVLLQLSAHQEKSLQELQDKAYDHFQTPRISPPEFAKAWQFEVTITETGWLEFYLDQKSLGRWLDCCRQELVTLEPEVILPLDQATPPNFRYHYLWHRCKDLSQLAKEFAHHGSPQWQFANYTIPVWEQTLLDGTVRFLFATLINQELGDRHFQTVDKAFWEFHRHCHLFAFYPAQPERFWHYCAWLDLVQAIAASHLSTSI
ncbi:hypothetical protein Lepto7376_1641 [[Leptolyngbya] sp. PCC 7376]|uniref:hypothetical protein n=1 Tax=[Leptolyngbya] sp. PCC 7376 TaxID=111781 RepID=UPI00029ECBAD|nr:hypothetical protein [[Leptolyngbya] sp. PCC 7376]AFY37975.1 hypothetical protein Lepto7376_1641 [[Leptolyngbya] sp. PCC 7376]